MREDSRCETVHGSAGERQDCLFLGRARAAVLGVTSSTPRQVEDAYLPGDRVYKILGDPAYPRSVHVWTAYRNAQETWKKNVNCALSSARVCVGWGFGNIKRRWALLNDKNRQKVFETGRQACSSSIMFAHF